MIAVAAMEPRTSRDAVQRRIRALRMYLATREDGGAWRQHSPTSFGYRHMTIKIRDGIDFGYRIFEAGSEIAQFNYPADAVRYVEWYVRTFA